jgi:hypothetical protein
MTSTNYSTDIGSDDSVRLQYESLRLQAIHGREMFFRRSLGLTLFIRKGLLAWVEVCSRCEAENIVSEKRETPSVFAFKTTSEMIKIMANIALSNLEESPS